jgi:hypothetical protein
MGPLVDRLPSRAGLIVFNVVRAACTVVPAVLGANWGTLLFMSVANRLQTPFFYTLDGAVFRRAAGAKDMENVTAARTFHYRLTEFLMLAMGLGLFLAHVNPVILLFTAAGLYLSSIPFVWTMVSSAGKAVKSASARAGQWGESARENIRAALGGLRKHWKEAAVLGASVGAAVLFHSPLFVAGAMMFWMSRTESFKSVWARQDLRASMLVSTFANDVPYAFRFILLPAIATLLVGAAGQKALLSVLSAAMLLGQILSNSSQLRLPSFRVPGLGWQISGQRLIQAAAVIAGVAWSLLSLFPHSALAAGATATLLPTLIWGSSKIPAKGWLRTFVIGMAAASLLPLFIWGSVPALFAAMFVLGLTAGPAVVVGEGYLSKNVDKAAIGKALGAYGMLLGTVMMFFYGLASLAIGAMTLPAALIPVAVACILIGGGVFFAPKFLAPPAK